MPWRPIGLWDVEASTVSRQPAHRWRWGCQLHAPAGRHLSPRKNPGTRFCWRLSPPEGRSAAVRIRSNEKIEWPDRESNPRPSGLYNSASTNYVTMYSGGNSASTNHATAYPGGIQMRTVRPVAGWTSRENTSKETIRKEIRVDKIIKDI
jgi:hypothetical protein